MKMDSSLFSRFSGLLLVEAERECNNPEIELRSNIQADSLYEK